MNLPIKIKKSAGVPVTPRVHKLIARGNNARSLAHWSAAADAYRAVLAADPSLRHIRIQLGHMLANEGRYEDAIAAYNVAAQAHPASGEPWLHMAHAAKCAGDRPRATRFYLAALAREGVENEAAEEAERLIQNVAQPNRASMKRIGALVREDGSLMPGDRQNRRIPPAEVARALDRVGHTLGDENASVLARARDVIERVACLGTISTAAETRPVVFDVTDLVAHFRNHRLPTGIQRVQIEVIARALAASETDQTSVCCFIDGRDYWLEIEANHFLELARLAGSGANVGDADWQATSSELFLSLAIRDHFVLPDKAILVNLGTSWWIYDYYRFIRNAKERQGISYVPFVHDFIPIMAPEHCVRGVVEDYVSWAVGVFQHADAFLVNSESTKRDLLRVAERLGHEVCDEDVEVVALDADFRKETDALPLAHLARWKLDGVHYALFVSTIESRKNHSLAFETWARLIRDHGDVVPQLVCVGRNGWLNDLAFERLAALPGLASKVTIINQVSDEELALLYRACRFTIYPSHYEGWGLPITESLCYGRVPVIADNSSLPEAGAGLAEVFASGSVSAFSKAVEAIAFDDERRAAMEAAIAERFRPRSWGTVAEQINGAITRLGTEDRPVRMVDQRVKPGLYYPTCLYRDAAIWHGLASGEVFRMDDGWLWAEVDGCRTTPEGGELRLVLDPAPAEARLFIKLRGLESGTTGVVVTVNGYEVLATSLKADETRWLTTDLPSDIGQQLSLLIRGDAAETVTVNNGGTHKQVTSSVTVCGFAICDADDEAQRARLTEALAYGDPETMSAYGRQT